MRSIPAIKISFMQLERSIVLALDHQDYVSSITLAGAAEEILGKLLELENLTPAYDDMKGVLIESAGKIPTIEKMCKHEYNEIMNGARNSLKHLREVEVLDVEQESSNIIHRAILNFSSLTGKKSELMLRWHNEVVKQPKYLLSGNI